MQLQDRLREGMWVSKDSVVLFTKIQSSTQQHACSHDTDDDP